MCMQNSKMFLSEPANQLAAVQLLKPCQTDGIHLIWEVL